MPQINESKEIVYTKAEVIEILASHAKANHGARELNLQHSSVRLGYSSSDDDFGYGHRQPDTIESIRLTFTPDKVK